MPRDKKLKTIMGEEKPPHDPAPPKPRSNEEVRLFTVNKVGQSPPGPNGEPPKNVISGVERVYLTKAEALKAGKVWRDKPFLGRMRRVGVRARAREDEDEAEGAGTDRDLD